MREGGGREGGGGRQRQRVKRLDIKRARHFVQLGGKGCWEILVMVMPCGTVNHTHLDQILGGPWSH